MAIACCLIELLVEDRADTVVILSGDTDLAPAARLARRLFPDKTVSFAFPFGRKNKELEQIVDVSFQISKSQYARHQFADPYVLKNGREISKPDSW